MRNDSFALSLFPPQLRARGSKTSRLKLHHTFDSAKQGSYTARSPYLIFVIEPPLNYLGRSGISRQGRINPQLFIVPP